MSQGNQLNQKLLSMLQNIADKSALKRQKNKSKSKPQNGRKKDEDEQALRLFQDIPSSSSSQEQEYEKEKQKKQNESQKFTKLKSILFRGNQNEEKKEKKKRVSIVENKNTVQPKEVQRQQYIVYGQNRRWNQQIKDEKKGKFDPQEKSILFKSLTQCITEKNIEYEAIVRSLSDEQDEKFPRDLHLWSQICGVLPNRSLVSCYKFFKRSLNRRKGKWTEQETQQLIELVQKYGPKWKKISKQLGRTSQNIRDKYRLLGEQNNEDIQKTLWRLQVLVQFLKLLQKYVKEQFLMEEIDKQLQNSEIHNRLEEADVKRRKKNTRSFLFHNNGVVVKYIKENFKSIKLENVKWKKISEKLKVKTVYDCRNKFVQLLQYELSNTNRNKEVEKNIIEFIINGKYKHEKQIDWQKGALEWQGVDSVQGKNRWMIIKRQIQGRSTKSFKQIVEGLKKKYNIEQ